MTPHDAWDFIENHLLDEIACGEPEAVEPLTVIREHLDCPTERTALLLKRAEEYRATHAAQVEAHAAWSAVPHALRHSDRETYVQAVDRLHAAGNALDAAAEALREAALGVTS